MIDPYVAPEPTLEPTPARRSPVWIIVGLVAVLLLVVGAVVIASDGGDDASELDAVALLSAAPDAAREAGSARMRMTMDVAGADLGEMGGEGLIDFANQAASLTFRFGGFDMEILTDGATLWMKMPALLGGLDKPWIAVPIPTNADSGMGFLGATDAASYLDALRGVGADVTVVGSEQVNGVDATHYAAVVDLREAIEQVPEEYRENAEAGLAMLGDGQMPIDVWITDGGLPVRMTFEYQLPALGSISMQMDLTDFGVPVDIEPPQADQVQTFDDIDQLQELFGGAAFD